MGTQNGYNLAIQRDCVYIIDYRYHSGQYVKIQDRTKIYTRSYLKLTASTQFVKCAGTLSKNTYVLVNHEFLILQVSKNCFGPGMLYNTLLSPYSIVALLHWFSLKGFISFSASSFINLISYAMVYTFFLI